MFIRIRLRSFIGRESGFKVDKCHAKTTKNEGNVVYEIEALDMILDENE